MDDFHLFLRGLFASTAAVLLVLALTYYLPLSDYFQSKDYYVERVVVTFDLPYVKEEITYRVKEGFFHEMFKVYYGKDPVVEVVCLDGGKPYAREVEDGLEVGCTFPTTLSPGSYKMAVTYEVGSASHLPWVVFNEVPRKVLSVSSNGYVPFSSSTMGEPVVAVLNPTLEDKLYFLAVRLFLLLPFIAGAGAIALLARAYFLHGRDEAEDVPDVYHDIPNDKRSPMEVALFFSGDPGNLGDVGSRPVDGALAHAVVEGAVDIKDGKVVVVDREALGRLPVWERRIVEALEGLSPKDITPVKALRIQQIVNQAFRDGIDKVFDRRGRKTAEALLVVGFIGVFLFATQLGDALVGAVFPIVDPNFRFFVPLSTFMSFIAASSAFLWAGKYALGRYRSGLYRERLLWDAFANLLRNESLLKEYGLEDKHMWGMWLAYAYALGVPERVVKLISQKAHLPAGVMVGKYGGAYRSALSTARSRRGGRGISLGGFRGGGRFGMR